MNSQFSGYLQRMDDEQSAREWLVARKETKDWKALIEGEWYQFSWNGAQEEITFLLREGRDRFMLLAPDRKLVTRFLEVVGIAAHVRRPRILVAKFVRDSMPPVNQPQTKFVREYRFTNVFASVDVYGRSLQTVSFWGEDLIFSELFLKILQDEKPPPTSYRVTVREMRRNVDICSVGSLGEVNFYFANEQQLHGVDRFFRYLKAKRYIRWGREYEGEAGEVEHPPSSDLDPDEPPPMWPTKSRDD